MVSFENAPESEKVKYLITWKRGEGSEKFGTPMEIKENLRQEDYAYPESAPHGVRYPDKEN